MRLAIVGSTKFENPAAREIATVIMVGYLSAGEPDLIISGGAVGVDTWAEEMADFWGIPKSIHLPKNKRWAPDGYKERNELIVEECTHLLRIVCRKSTTYGSGWTADQAERMGKTVWQVYL